MASRPLPAPPAQPAQPAQQQVGFTEAAHPAPLQPQSLHPQPVYSQPYRDSTFGDESFAHRSSYSFHDDKGMEGMGGYEQQAHGADPEDAYYPDVAYGPQSRGGGANGIWSYDDRRAFQRQSFLMKLLRLLAFILVMGIIIALAVVMLIVMFLRPPNIGLQNIRLPSSDDIKIQNEVISVTAYLDTVISNPNYISAQVNDLKAVAYDANARATSIGNCSVPHRTIQARQNTELTVPCDLLYDVQKDKDLSIIKDLVNRCGLVKGSSKQKLQILLDAHVTIQLLAFHIPISVSPTVNVDCPISRQQVKQALGKHADILKQLGLGDLRRSLPNALPDGVRRLAILAARAWQAPGAPDALVHDSL
ncbi:hypothetical protein MOBT1_003022 [Malassezia obtusa]|uniref:Late embryogenesis abundant protein LEA-2 subgroup domain-containing protein n=1 Tax=Malassezia obtusa TaxID=76774 RepID=A0AAF0E3E9_9BASI|nr:hypothetical protein MOBT1_003022 [Malassezia obtusa]